MKIIKLNSNNILVKGFVILLGIVFVFACIRFITHNDSGVPKSIDNKLAFQALLPAKSQTSSTFDKSTFKYDETNKVLTFIAYHQGVKITIAEQSYPEVLIYDKLVGTMNEYSEVQTKPGKVALTKPKTLHGAQTAVLSTYNGTSGVLLFAKPEKNLANDQWTQFFNILEVSP